MIEIEQTGSFARTLSWLHFLNRWDINKTLEKYALQGLEALQAATPVKSGKTAQSWEYKIDISTNQVVIEWYNTNENKGVPIAIILQYGHGTGTGGYVRGIDYINPAMRPIFDSIADELFQEVMSA